MPTVKRDCGSRDGRNSGVVGSRGSMTGRNGNVVKKGNGHGEDGMEGLHQCLLQGCYSNLQKCDGKFDCEDRADEHNCEYWTIDGLFSNLEFYSLFC